MNANVEISNDSQKGNMLDISSNSSKLIQNGKFTLLIKSIVYFLLMTALLVNSTIGKVFDSQFKPNCFEDVTFRWNANANEYLKDTTLWDIILIFASGLIDFLLLFILIQWIIKGKTWRGIISFISFYGFRGIIQVR
jgi:hypothetical protein